MGYPAYSIRLSNGNELLLSEAEAAIELAMRIIEKVGTTGIEDTKTIGKADFWLRRYYPERV